MLKHDEWMVKHDDLEVRQKEQKADVMTKHKKLTAEIQEEMQTRQKEMKEKATHHGT